jgi:hypothetical protein
MEFPRGKRVDESEITQLFHAIQNPAKYQIKQKDLIIQRVAPTSAAGTT